MPVKLSAAEVHSLCISFFGPNAEQPDPDILNSHRHQVAMDFQVGSLMFEFTHGIKVVLEKEKKKKVAFRGIII